jgi:hypothetical protein
MPHIIIMGIPDFVMLIMRLQHSMNISLGMPSIGIISQTMPVSVISQVKRHIIGIIIIGIIIGMLFIMPGIGIIIGFIMPVIMVGIGIAAALVMGIVSSLCARRRVLEIGVATRGALSRAARGMGFVFPPIDWTNCRDANDFRCFIGSLANLTTV